MEMEEDDHVQVVIRVRPPIEREIKGSLGIEYQPSIKQNDTDISVSGSSHSFSFDRVYGNGSTQRELYENTAKSVVQSCLEGYNATIFAYGQTGTGKTYTMEGAVDTFEDRGIVPRAIEQIFTHIQEKASAENRFLVRVSYLQIYNDCIYDLLQPDGVNLTIREEDKNKENSKGIYVDGLSEYIVRSPQEIFHLMAQGSSCRATGTTKLNQVSSRSHAVLKLIVEQCETSCINPSNGEDISVEEFEALIRKNELQEDVISQMVRQRFRVAKLNLVDLAGSERVRVSGASGTRLQESMKINKSLSALGNVIAALADGRQHVPYRDSKLTRILEDSLGGNCRTTMIAMVSPAMDSAAETLSTLKFANRAKNIRNHAHINEDVDKNSLLRKYQRELKRLRKELELKSQNVVDQRVVLELEDQKRRAEADKVAALRALESRSFEFMREKQEKKKLEEKIADLESQMVVGGHHLNGELIHESPQFRQALTVTRDKIRAQYKEKMIDLEKEREQIEAQKAQVGRYKQLLLKQRDIMVALTQRLNERDDQIVSLQDELDGLKESREKVQETLDDKNAQLIHLERLYIESNGDDNQRVGLESRVRALTSQYQSFRDEMTERLTKKDSQLKKLREENADMKMHLDSSDGDNVFNEVEHLRLRSLNHAKEQMAMQTIMEKINILVLNISTQLTDESMRPRVRELSTLVAASVSALSNKK